MFNFLNVSDARGLVPVAITALIGVAIWYLWKRAQARQDAGNALDAGASTGGANVADLALLQTLLSQNAGTAAPSGSNAPTQKPATASNAFESVPVTQGAA